jgi:hypothetical protein
MGGVAVTPDRAATVFSHKRDGVLGRVEERRDVRLPHEIPGLGGQVDSRTGARQGRVVEDDVESTQCGEGCGDHGFHLCGVAHVGLARHGPSTGSGDQVSDLLGSVAPHVGHHHSGTLGREAHGA